MIKIESPEVKRIVQEYDFTFVSGYVLPITVDPMYGDTIIIGSETIRVYLGPKPSIADPAVTLYEENITLYVKHLATMNHRRREVVELTAEQKYEWNQEIRTKLLQ